MGKEHRFAITLYNSLGRELKPLDLTSEVKMYVCGVTPYDNAHLGHGRCYVTFDLLHRLLNFLGYKVVYCRNFTDVDDKLINRAETELQDPGLFLKIANTYIERFHEDMKALGCLSPTYEPRVTTHMASIIRFIEGLISADKAYATDEGDVYYRISSFKAYGKLSQRSLDELKVGARVAARTDKENPLDFALWKSTDKQPGWESPWGLGRPGWHIECSAMASDYLGETFDIHGGGMDLIFPHHENEIAQSEGLHEKPFARYWVHNAFVRINEEKMSKSLGNFLTLRDAYTQFSPMVLRYYYLIHHYRNPLDFSPADIESAAKSYQRLCQELVSVEAASASEIFSSTDTFTTSLIKALCDDLSVARVLGQIFEALKTLSQEQKSQVKGLMQEVLGLDMKIAEKVEILLTPEMEALLEERQLARLAKDWEKADKIRDRLKELGYEAQDKKL